MFLRLVKFIFKSVLWLVIVVAVAVFLLSRYSDIPDRVDYGVSFSKFHADELKVDWKESFLAILDQLKVKKLRLSAHWPMLEPDRDKYNFQELDFQLQETRTRDASVILAIGRRLPGWPECHDPDWVRDLSVSERQERILKMLETIVNRYKDYDNIVYWQVENEPFLTFFSRFNCGQLDKDFLLKEIALVKRLDPSRPILLTDSGELSTWYGPYKNSDVFGTSIYLYIWNRSVGPLRYPIGPWFFRAKLATMRLLLGNKESLAIELSAEPWLLQPIVDTPFQIQLSRMDVDKFNEVIEFSRKTGFNTFYLWGAEWWYWMKLSGRPEMWNRAAELFEP